MRVYIALKWLETHLCEQDTLNKVHHLIALGVYPKTFRGLQTVRGKVDFPCRQITFYSRLAQTSCLSNKLLH